MQPHNASHTAVADEHRPTAGARGEATAVAQELSHDAHSHMPVNSAPGTGRRLTLGVAVLAVGLGAAFWFRHHQNANAEATLESATESVADAPSPVDVVKVGYAPSARLVTLPGQTRAWYESTIYARVSGYIDKWNADIGDRVKKGQLLATIETPELDDQLKAAVAKVESDQAQVAVAKANFEFAKSTYDRWWQSPSGVVSEQEKEEKKADRDSAQAKYNAAAAQVNLDNADVERLEALEAFKKVVAPYDGVITDRRVDIGDLVTAGSTASTTSLYDIAQADKMRIFVDVPQKVSSEIKVGMAAPTTSQQFPGRKFEGTVARTANAIDPAAKTLRVEVDVDNTDAALLPGMYVEVSFRANDESPSLQVPASALSFRTGGPQVAVVGSNGVVRFHDVSIARDMGDFVELATGVSANDRVALNISNQISDGDRVDPTEVSTGGTPVTQPQPERTKTAMVERAD